MRFCLQCGHSLARPAPPAPSAARTEPPTQASHHEAATVPLKIAATPVISPRAGSGSMHPRPSFHDEKIEIDEEALKKSFERHVTQPGVIVCRFCKGPLDLTGDFCEQCGAPVTEAAPPGTVVPKPPPAPVAPPPMPNRPVQSSPPTPAPAQGRSVTGLQPSASPPSPPRPAAPSLPPRPTAPAAPVAPPVPPPEEPPAGLMGRLKGIFKKT